jgi:excisionase family DNA binding protein
METEVRTEWLSNRDAEKLTSLSRTTLWRLARAGEIKVARVGRAVRINRRSLEEYLERTVDAT